MKTSTQAFTPEAVRAMSRAYDVACNILTNEGASHAKRIKAGEQIIFLARNGETDERKLCRLALEDALGYVPIGAAA